MEQLLTASHDYNHSVTNAPLAPDSILQGRYLIVRQLGRGGMGAVYEALDQRLGITVALKETLSSEESMRRQFEREARLLAGMQHSALPRVTDHFVEGNRAFLVMEFIGGIDLAKIIAQQPGPFPRDQVIAWADQLLDALIYLHSRDRQVIHRDIKPHNLKLTANGQVALLDFGLAKTQSRDQSITASQSFYGYTRHYAPLEQIQDQHTDSRSDIYALGATLYHLLTGIKPPDAMVRATALVNGEPDPLQPANQIHAIVGPQLAAILNKAMAQKPDQRYPDAGAFREALRRMGRTRTEDEKLERVGAGKVDVTRDRDRIHISEITAVRRPTAAATVSLHLVGSARRFGPAGATAVLALVVTLAAGLLYGSQRWFPSAAKSAVTPASETAAMVRQAATSRKSERVKTSEGIEVVTPKTRSISDDYVKNRVVEKSRDVPAPTTPAGGKPATFIKFALAPTREPALHRDVTVRPNATRVGAPSIRLPQPELRDNGPMPSPESSNRSYGSPSATPSRNIPPPKFYRAADGTRIVKFSDGSTASVQSQKAGSYR
jgi:predicted Ser/Thr protein kinase